MHIPLIYQDENLVIVNKPVGLNVHSDEGTEGSTDLVSMLKRQLDLSYLGIHHRLDREVSGVLAFTARNEANSLLAGVFEGRKAVKEYFAIVTGRPPQKSGFITAPIIPNKNFWQNKGDKRSSRNAEWAVASPGSAGAKEAVTQYKVEARGPNYSFIRLTLETGRTHQLRVHLAHIGCPIVGDPVYGQPLQAKLDKSKGEAGMNFPRLLLHAARLYLPDPFNVNTEAPPPPVFSRASLGLPLPELALANRLSSGSVSTLQDGDQAGLNALLELARDRRAPLAEDPTLENTAYRLVNSHGDGLTGITLDCYAGSLVLNCYDPVLEAGHPALKLLLAEISRVWPQKPVYVKFRPRHSSQLGEIAPPEIAPSQPLAGRSEEEKPEVLVQENGLNYLIRPSEGLSPGLFLDMREVRARVRKLSSGKKILNLFSYSCGFGVAGTAGGASRVLNIDASRKSLDWGKENYRANFLSAPDFDFVDGDVFDWLGRLSRKGETFDFVILDPPSYSTTHKTRWSAEQNYDKLAALAAKVISPGGVLLACSNHAGLNRKTFRTLVLRGIDEAGCKAEVEGVYHEPNLDFPLSSETEGYLKVLMIRLSKKA